MKLARQAEILKLIHEYEIETQEELAKKLVEHGFEVTQATVSRDIRDMQLTKTAGSGGHLRYALLKKPEQHEAGRYVRVLKDAVLHLDLAGNLLVIRTSPGMAMAAAAVLDELQWQEIVGCLAGDDTIFCAVRSQEEALRVMDKLKKVLRTV